MDISLAVDALEALAHETRLSVFRLLVKAGPAGLTAGAIAEDLQALANTMSSHLAKLHRAGIVTSERDGRYIIYRADFDASAWDTLAVPGNWQCQGYGTPLYSNITYPFKKDPPRIMGDRTGLHFMAIIVAIFFWGSALGGILGMILAIPLTAFLVVFWRLAREKYIQELV